MVAKQMFVFVNAFVCLNLAKIHMVAKRNKYSRKKKQRLNLAKIHMVAKPVIVL